MYLQSWLTCLSSDLTSPAIRSRRFPQRTGSSGSCSTSSSTIILCSHRLLRQVHSPHKSVRANDVHIINTCPVVLAHHCFYGFSCVFDVLFEFVICPSRFNTVQQRHPVDVTVHFCLVEKWYTCLNVLVFPVFRYVSRAKSTYSSF